MLDRDILLSVDKPARYVGGEYNLRPVKSDAPLQFCMCFPDVYEVAMSNLGIRILYEALNRRLDTSCEFCFTPWPDYGAKLEEHGLPLSSLGSGKPLKSFDIIGFSLQYEMSYSNMLYMLKLAGIPIYAKDRTADDPIVMVGGPCCVNPEPIRDFCDIVNIGDGEERIDELAALYTSLKQQFPDRAARKSAYLNAVDKLTGEYVPSVNPSGATHVVQKSIVQNLDAAVYPTCAVLSNIEAVHDRGVVELFRGCTRGCRFCQAGFIYRPIRERSVETLVRQAREIVKHSGHTEMSMSSLSSGDYSHIHELVEAFGVLGEEYRTTFALPSLRMDSFDPEMVAESRLNSLTFAPEAGTQRLRDVINKNVTEQNILDSTASAFASGYHTVKLYFMIGLPTETEADLQGIVDICAAIKKNYYTHRTSKKRLTLSASTSTFIPKPFTPFQWERQITIDEMREKQVFLKTHLRQIGVNYHYHDSDVSELEAVFARGDAKLVPVLARAAELGCKFDGWTEHFRYDLYVQAFSDCGVDYRAYLDAFDTAKPLSWDFIDVGVTKQYFLREREAAYQAVTTPDCRKHCLGCGITKLAHCPLVEQENAT